jgi:hypothetical protein
VGDLCPPSFWSFVKDAVFRIVSINHWESCPSLHEKNIVEQRGVFRLPSYYDCRCQLVIDTVINNVNNIRLPPP